MAEEKSIEFIGMPKIGEGEPGAVTACGQAPPAGKNKLSAEARLNAAAAATAIDKFHWASTPQGHDYWSGICGKLWRLSEGRDD